MREIHHDQIAFSTQFALWYAEAIPKLMWPGREWRRRLPDETAGRRYELDDRGDLWVVLTLGDREIIRVCVPPDHWAWGDEAPGEKIYWFGEYYPIPAQVEELLNLVGDRVDIVHDDQITCGADELVKRYQHSGCVDLVVAAPLSVVASLIERGIQPLCPEMRPVDDLTDLARQVLIAGQAHEFVRFRRITDDDEVK